MKTKTRFSQKIAFCLNFAHFYVQKFTQNAQILHKNLCKPSALFGQFAYFLRRKITAPQFFDKSRNKSPQTRYRKQVYQKIVNDDFSTICLQRQAKSPVLRLCRTCGNHWPWRRSREAPLRGGPEPPKSELPLKRDNFPY